MEEDEDTIAEDFSDEIIIDENVENNSSQDVFEDPPKRYQELTILAVSVIFGTFHHIDISKSCKGCPLGFPPL